MVRKLVILSPSFGHFSNEVLAGEAVVRRPAVRADEEPVDSLDRVGDHPQQDQLLDQWLLRNHRNVSSLGMPWSCRSGKAGEKTV